MSSEVVEGDLLVLDKVTKVFGGITAVDAVSLSIREGTISGIIGPNGSGKTTLFNVVTGQYRPTGGQVLLGGMPIGGLKPHQICQRGISRTFQATRLFRDSTVYQNVLTGTHQKCRCNVADAVLRDRRFALDEEAAAGRAMTLLDQFGLLGEKDQLARSLSAGRQRYVEIVRALACEPRLLLLDEPTAGLAPEEATQLMRLIKQVQGRGVTISIVEHNMRVIVGVCEWIWVLSFGQKIAEGPPMEMMRHPKVVETYLGGEFKIA